MDFNVVAGLSFLGNGFLGYIIPFLFVLTIVVFFHELGHFFVARWCGVAVKTFSIGFGPEIVGFNDRHGTRWRLSWIPLGGYVKFFGDENAASATLGQYLMGAPNVLGVPTVFGLPVVEDENVPVDTVVVAPWAAATSIFDREQSAIRVGLINDQLIRNQQTILAEQRLAFVVWRPSAIVRITGY